MNAGTEGMLAGSRMGQEAYANAARGNGARSLADMPEQRPALMALVDNIDKSNAVHYDALQRMRRLLMRLANPRAAEANPSSGEVRHTPDTLEGRLQVTLSTSQEIGTQMHDVLSELERIA